MEGEVPVFGQGEGPKLITLAFMKPGINFAPKAMLLSLLFFDLKPFLNQRKYLPDFKHVITTFYLLKPF